MQKLLATITLAFFITTCLHASETTPPLTIELSDPKVRITIPGMPEIDMEVHPMNVDEPIFRLRGNAGTTSISVITPKIDNSITPMACANAIVKMVVTQSTATRDQLFLGRADEKTFLIIYGLPIEQSVLLNTHIISAVDTTQCIEAHVSKISTSDADIEPWFNGFGESKIESFQPTDCCWQIAAEHIPFKFARARLLNCQGIYWHEPIAKESIELPPRIIAWRNRPVI